MLFTEGEKINGFFFIRTGPERAYLESEKKFFFKSFEGIVQPLRTQIIYYTIFRFSILA